MTKKKKKPSKRGKKANKNSLHCSPMIVTQEKKMKKIMFNDRYGLTKAVLSGYKTVTRRIMNRQPDPDDIAYMKPLIEWCKSFFELL